MSGDYDTKTIVVPAGMDILRSKPLFHRKPMNIFIDVDYTLLSASGLLRPHTCELLTTLTGDGHSIFIWSGMGIRRDEIANHGLDHLITGYSSKPIDDYVAKLQMDPPPRWPDLVVDDHDSIVQRLGGITVKPYLFVDVDDMELKLVSIAIREFDRTGTCSHPRFVLPPQRPVIRGSNGDR